MRKYFSANMKLWNSKYELFMSRFYVSFRFDYKIKSTWFDTKGWFILFSEYLSLRPCLDAEMNSVSLNFGEVRWQSVFKLNNESLLMTEWGIETSNDLKTLNLSREYPWISELLRDIILDYSKSLVTWFSYAHRVSNLSQMRTRNRFGIENLVCF